MGIQNKDKSMTNYSSREQDIARSILFSEGYKSSNSGNCVLIYSENIKRYVLCSEPGSSVSIVPGYGLDDRAVEVRSPTEAKEFFL
jgi:hypothetical protein